MNEIEHLLTIFGEECAEAAQRASKAIRFGLAEVQPGQPDDNRRRLEREYSEVVAMADLLGLKVRDEDKAAKVEKVKKFMAYSSELGTLKPEEKVPACADGSSCVQAGGCGNPEGNDWCSNCGAILAAKDGKSHPSCDSCS